ncbi:hypothetical protein HU200_019897 [Digitaria exilis]|uniref:Uncharacterized protein n=1 Tax=Digitaria exilis TaxID=1010633 RepID=A0A835F112_9POAL|nr:hypothetical protein HU200_019897 [Digitaria exilis]
MAGMAVSASTGVMNSLLSKLSTLLSDKYNLLKGVRRDIEFLNGELLEMNAALQKLTDMEKLDGQNKVWRDKIREMAYDIEDCIDIFMHHHDSDDKQDGLFHKTARKIRKLRVRYRIASEIQKLKARVAEQSQSRNRYKIEESTSKITAVEVDPRLPALFEESKRLVGIDVPREKITKLLMEEDDSDSGQRKVVSIVGFGGLGKTTVAKQVYEEIKVKFECKAFVSVSRSPDIPKILKGILSGDGLSLVMMLMPRVQLFRRYLIVIDDLWSIEAWNTIECALVKNTNGSRVIKTTRKHEVAKACCTGFPEHVYHMEPLSDLHSRWLFFKRVFGTENSCPEEFRQISADMLRKCKGVPLAIISIASLLAIKTRDVDTWEKILKSLGSEVDTNPNLNWMRHVLSLSYNDLDPELKTCLLYLASYPEDYAIERSDLLNKWIAEGFIRERRGLELEEAAESRFNELINRSMIEPVYRYSDANMSHCRVHDLMLDLIISKCREENFVTIIDGQFISMNEASQARRVSHQSGNRDIALAVERISGPHVRSYISFPAADCIPPLSKFEHLRILDMMGRYSDRENMCVDLSAINQPFLLRYLKISGFGLKLPKNLES